MPINRRSQSRRAHVETKARENYRSAFDKNPNGASTIDQVPRNKAKKRGDLKKR